MARIYLIRNECKLNFELSMQRKTSKSAFVSNKHNFWNDSFELFISIVHSETLLKTLM